MNVDKCTVHHLHPENFIQFSGCVVYGGFLGVQRREHCRCRAGQWLYLFRAHHAFRTTFLGRLRILYLFRSLVLKSDLLKTMQAIVLSLFLTAQLIIKERLKED